MNSFLVFLLALLVVTIPTWYSHAADLDDDNGSPELDRDLKAEKIALKTDDQTAEREAEAINPDGFSLAEKKLLDENAEQFEFQAEVNKLMGLIINSLYSNKEIFLRELISNASDALDKIRFEALTDKAVLGENQDLVIRIKPDPENKQLHLIDTGIGMTKQDLVNNLGTIAQSGTKDFLNKLEQSNSDDQSLIGQFGVGFYSSYLVADLVTVTSKNNNDDQYVWSSGADSAFTVSKDPRGNTLGRGTVITLHLKEDALEYLEPERIKELVAKYSEFINFPIYLYESHVEEREVPVEESEEDAQEAEEGVTVEEESEEDTEEEEDDMEDFEIIEETVWEWVLLNDTKPLWTRDVKEIEDEEYKKFYKAITHDPDDPLTWTHFKAEGDLEFRAILFVPESPPKEAFNTKTEASKEFGLKLYVRRVFITDNFSAVIPKYLSFVRGVIDSGTLKLNVSREILQQDKSLKMMEKKLIRKIIAMIQQISQDEEKYDDFYDDYKIFLKLGVVEDKANKTRLAKLLRFHTSKSAESRVSLSQYVENMKEGQEQIYFLCGESDDFVSNSPLLEKLKKRGYEVIFMTDPIDEYLSQSLNEFDGKKLVNIAKEGDLKLDDDLSEEEKKELEEEYEALSAFLKKQLSSKISKVVISNRLTNSPSALVSSGYGYTANMERILKAQALTTGNNQFIAPKKVLEINPNHPIIRELNRRVLSQEEGAEDDAVAVEIALVMYDTAALNSGFILDDLKGFAKRITNMMKNNLNIEYEEEEEVVEEEEEVEAASEETPAEAEGEEAQEAEETQEADEAQGEDAEDAEHTHDEL